MKFELTLQEVDILLAFLNRVGLKGSEAETLVILKQKFRLPPVAPKPKKISPAPKEEPKPEPKD